MKKTFAVLAIVIPVLVVAGCGKKAPDKATATGPAKTLVKATTQAAKPKAASVDHLAAAIAKAKKEKKDVFVEYYSPTCNFCTEMDKEVYSDDFVKSELGDVVYVRLTQGKDGGPFEKRWTRLGTPSFAILKPDGTQIGKTITGKLDLSGMLKLLSWAAKPKGPMPAVAAGGS